MALRPNPSEQQHAGELTSETILKFKPLERRANGKSVVDVLLQHDARRQGKKQLFVGCAGHKTMWTPEQIAGLVIELLAKKDSSGKRLDFDIMLSGGTKAERDAIRAANRTVRRLLAKLADKHITREEVSIRLAEVHIDKETQEQTTEWHIRRTKLVEFLTCTWEHYEKTYLTDPHYLSRRTSLDPVCRQFYGLLKRDYAAQLKDPNFKLERTHAEAFFKKMQQKFNKEITDTATDFLTRDKERKEAVDEQVQVKAREAFIDELAAIACCMVPLSEQKEVGKVNTRFFHAGNPPTVLKIHNNLACLYGYVGDSVVWEPIVFSKKIVEAKLSELFPVEFPAQPQKASEPPRSSATPSIAVPHAKEKRKGRQEEHL